MSPDGKFVAFTVERPNVEANSKPKQIYVVPVTGGSPIQITTEGSNQRPRWTHDSKSIIFVSSRGGSSQIWSMKPDGSEQRAITSLATEAGGVIVSPDDQWIVFTSEVFPDCADDACNKAKSEAAKNNKVKARVYTSLLYRHWTDWQSATRKHLLIAPIDGGPAKDSDTRSIRYADFFTRRPDDYAFSPDSKELAYVTNTERSQSISTNTDIFVVPISGGEPKRITLERGPTDHPVYSPDGKYLAFRSQARQVTNRISGVCCLFERATGRTVR